MALGVVVGLAVVGRAGAASPSVEAERPVVAVAEATALRTPLAELDPDARPTVVPFAPYPVAVVKPRRQTGTDGFLPGLPFDVLPEPTPGRIDRFTIDDLVATGRPTRSTTPPWVHRIGGFTNYRVDPYQK